MNRILQNILAVIAGAIVGSAVNMGIVIISGSIIPPPAGADLSTPEGLKAAMSLFEPKHFLMPFLAHALGTLAGALIAAWIAKDHKLWYAIGIGGLFLVGGVINIFMLPSPLWFTLVDLAAAYLPIAYLAGKVLTCKR